MRMFCILTSLSSYLLLLSFKSYVQRRKERYDSSSPAKVEELEVELKDEKSKYGMLIEKYEALSKRLEETQVLLDTVKTEIENEEC